jgi:hypothetical protein
MVAKSYIYVPHPSGVNLAFYPEDSEHRQETIRAYNPSPKEVVDMALSHKPLLIHPPSNE